MVKILDFYADWCGPCKIMSPILEELEKDYSGKISFEKVDVEAKEALASQYGIMSIPTFVMIKEDKEIDRRTGAMPKEVFKSWVDSKLK